MRFIYGIILGVMASVIGAILYLAFADGAYLLQLSPRYHDMQSTIAALSEAKMQRDQLTARLESLAGSFNDLSRRFNELRETGCDPTPGRPATAATETAPIPPPAPKPDPDPTPAAAPAP